MFISYAHLDNQAFGPDDLHWITHLHEQLASRVPQLIGDEVSVWRDEKLQGNDVFPDTLLDRLAKVAALVSVCSPRYLNSEWCRRELDAFIRTAEDREGIEIGTKSRVFKVLKTPVSAEQLPAPLIPLLGYQFYEELPGDHVREYLLNPDPEERWKFYARLDDLAQDIAGLLGAMAAVGPRSRSDEPGDRSTVYLAETTSDASPFRDGMRRELERRGHRVLPGRALPLTVDGLTSVVHDSLSVSTLSIHILGARYGARPEDDDRSIPHLQLEIARQWASDGQGTQLVWIPDEATSPVEDQATLIDELLVADLGSRVEVVQAPPEAFKAYLLAQLAAPPPDPEPVGHGDGKRIYLVHDRDDQELVGEVRAALELVGHVVVLPIGTGSESEIRQVHETAMVVADAVLICYGDATEHWLRMKLFDVLKAPGWGRRAPFVAVGVLVAPPTTAHKRTYATAEAIVLPALDGFQPSVLEPFLDRLAPAATAP